MPAKMLSRFFSSAASRERRGHGSRFLPFYEAREAIRAHSFQSSAEWRAWCREGRRPGNIPSNPNKTYANTGWKGYPDWLGFNNGMDCKTSCTDPDDRMEQKLPSFRTLRTKELFLRHSGGCDSFHIESLPLQSSAQFVYRKKDDVVNASWCPLILRSKQSFSVAHGGSIFIEAPKAGVLKLGGVFLLFRESQQLYYLPTSFRAQTMLRPAATSGDGASFFKIEARVGRTAEDLLQQYELRSSAMFEEALEANHHASTLLEESRFAELFCRPRVAATQNLVHQLVQFLRHSCGATVHRPTRSTGFFAAHFIVDGAPVWTRTCKPQPRRSMIFQVRVCDADRTVLGRDFAAGDVEEEEQKRPAFIFAMIRGHGVDHERLSGFFLFPLKYVRRLLARLRRKRGRSCVPYGRESFYVYPHGRTPKNSTVCNQDRFFIDLSPSANALESAEKAKEILAECTDAEDTSHVADGRAT